MQSDYGSSTLSQLVVAEWLSNNFYDSHLDKVREQLRIRRKVALNALDKYLRPYATWDIPKGGLFIWVKIKPEFKVKRLFEKAFSNNILLNPGSIYAEKSGQFIRISYGYASLDEIKEGLFQLSEIIKIQ